MSTAIELTEQELVELRAFTKEAEDAAAVRSAMTEYLRFARRMQLKALSGQVEMEDNWRTLESLEMRNASGNLGLGAH